MQIDPSKISKAVTNFVKTTMAMGGEANKIDTKQEYDKIGEYLSGNKGKLSNDAEQYLESLQYEYKAQVQNREKAESEENNVKDEEHVQDMANNINRELVSAEPNQEVINDVLCEIDSENAASLVENVLKLNGKTIENVNEKPFKGLDYGQYVKILSSLQEKAIEIGTKTGSREILSICDFFDKSINNYKLMNNMGQKPDAKNEDTINKMIMVLTQIIDNPEGIQEKFANE